MQKLKFQSLSQTLGTRNNITTFVFLRWLKWANLFGDPFHVRYSKLSWDMQVESIIYSTSLISCNFFFLSSNFCFFMLHVLNNIKSQTMFLQCLKTYLKLNKQKKKNQIKHICCGENSLTVHLLFSNIKMQTLEGKKMQKIRFGPYTQSLSTDPRYL